MKEKKTSELYEAIGNIPDAYISEAAGQPTLKRRRRGYLAVLAATLALLLILPTVALIASFSDPLKGYRNDPYFNVISSIVRGRNEADYLADLQKGNLFDRFFELFKMGAGAATDGDFGITGDRYDGGSTLNGSDALNGSDDDEITDNQVEGVLEADIIKRNTTHIFYLSYNRLAVYTLAGEESAKVAELALTSIDDKTSYNNFYLIENSLILEGIHHGDGGVYTRLMTLSIDDLLDGTVEREPVSVTLQGSLISTRLTEGGLIATCGYYYYDDADFDRDDYLPHYESEDGMVAIAPDKITAPETPSESFYTAIYLLDRATLSVKDAHALLGEPSAQYVSGSTVYLVSESEMLISQDGEAIVFDYELNADRRCVKSKTVSYIEAISYTDEGFSVLGGLTVDGSVKDQYSMDEYDGILRVATSTSESSYVLNSLETRINGTRLVRNASLYLVSLDSFTVLSSAVNFAPFGETVQSARFDDDIAYICTAEVVTFTDPVYRFDLSDPTRISSLDTGTIDGYSTSLVELDNGDLLGIGYGADRGTLKLEIYRRGKESLESVTSYEIAGCEFSEEYKSYYIDREANLFGVVIFRYSERIGGVTYYVNRMQYLLFSYDGESLTVVNELSIGESYRVDSVRGFVYEDDLYVLHPDGIRVAPVGCATNG